MESVDINGRVFRIERVLSRNRHANARLSGESIVVSIPSRWPAKDKEDTFDTLLKRAIKAISDGKWNPDAHTRLIFSHGQTVDAMGHEFHVRFIPASRFGSRIEGSTIEVKVVLDHPQSSEKASHHVKRRMAEALMPYVDARVRAINSAYFNAEIGKVKIRETTSIWGSCSPKGDILLNFRLLFLPGCILDYVIAHEIAHLRYKSHGKRFWALVERAVPDHRERRKWLRENGWAPLRPSGQRTLSDFSLGN